MLQNPYVFDVLFLIPQAVYKIYTDIRSTPHINAHLHNLILIVLASA